MQFGLIGLSHQTASVTIREKTALDDSEKKSLMKAILSRGANEVVILGTCGRFEIYYVSTAEDFSTTQNSLLNLLEDSYGVTKSWYLMQGVDAIHHLFRVASGLDSAVLGEDQILGQTKNALTLSADYQCSGKILNKLFREAISFAKHIKTELKISESPLSLSYIAIKKAKAYMTFDKETIITLVGLGKMGSIAIKYLFELPFKNIYIAVRNPERLPNEILEHDKIMIVPFEERYEAMCKSHLTITSTAAPHPVIKKKYLHFEIENPVLIDLAMPRDCEPLVYSMEGIKALHVDDLKEVSEENLKRRHELVERADKLILDRAQSCLKWIEATKVDDLLKAWHETIDEIKLQTLDILYSKVDISSLSSKELIDKQLESALKKMIRQPLENLKSMEDSAKREQSIQLLKELYGYE